MCNCGGGSSNKKNNFTAKKVKALTNEDLKDKKIKVKVSRKDFMTLRLRLKK